MIIKFIFKHVLYIKVTIKFYRMLVKYGLEKQLTLEDNVGKTEKLEK